MSQSLWQIGKPDLNAFFLPFFFFFPEQQTFQIWVGHNFVQYEIWNLIFGWTRYKKEQGVEEVCCSKCFIVSVMSFHLYFDKQVHKTTAKKLSKKKIKSWNFAESNAHWKTNGRGSFEKNNFFFLSLLNVICLSQQVLITIPPHSLESLRWIDPTILFVFNPRQYKPYLPVYYHQIQFSFGSGSQQRKALFDTVPKSNLHFCRLERV